MEILLIAAAKELHTDTSDVSKELKLMMGVLSELGGLFSRRTQGRGNINALKTEVLEKVNRRHQYLLGISFESGEGRSDTTSGISVLGGLFKKAQKVRCPMPHKT